MTSQGSYRHEDAKHFAQNLKDNVALRTLSLVQSR